MRFAIIYFLAFIFPALSVLAQRGGGGGGGRGGRPGRPATPPNTLITVASSARPAATAAPAPAPAAGGNGGGNGGNAAVNAALIPPFGVTAGVKANDGTANCVGTGGVAIPCDCPPNLNTFVSAVASSVAGGAAFPAGNSAADQLTRLQTCIVTLQNFRGGPGSGVGCPIVSTNWKALQTQLQGQV